MPRFSIAHTARSRRWVLTRAGAAAAAVAVPTAWFTRSALAQNTGADTGARAEIDMEMLLVAAQVDPPKPDTETTPGAEEHVTAVEEALQAKDLLDAAQVDGHFGTTTVAAYIAWQEELGYSGLDANGMPGETSLEELADGAFTIGNPVTPGSRDDSYAGERTNTRTVEMLGAADEMLSWDIIITQGSYTSDNPGSAGTHDGGGVIDIGVNEMDETQRWETVKALRTVGFAAWLRTPDQGFDYHIHAVGVAEPDLSAEAQAQVHDYFVGKDGLANHGPDNTPEEYQVDFTWWEEYQRG